MSIEKREGIRKASFQNLKRTKKVNLRGKIGRHGVVCRVNCPRGSFSLHCHDFIEIEYLLSGKIEHELNGYRSTLSAGDCWCLGTRDLHMFTVIEPVKIHNICLDTSAVPKAVAELLSSTPFPLLGHISEELLPTVASLFESLFAVSLEDMPYANERVAAYLLLILTHIFESSEPLSEKPSTAGYEHIAQAIEYISEHYYEALTLGEVASVVHLSPNYFSKLFCDVSGKTFLDYLTYIRISKARELLSGTSDSITQVALVTGFGSFSSFSRTFRKHVGTTPSEYRKSMRERRFAQTSTHNQTI